jgi:hypothetical protein
MLSLNLGNFELCQVSMLQHGTLHRSIRLIESFITAIISCARASSEDSGVSTTVRSFVELGCFLTQRCRLMNDGTWECGVTFVP